ncbi:hypothetical protein N7465_009737 [Penicillium sp. CMV-2018d]|nr:hypothetical protein N7465_009737 [Penicillium sp. CMV-2018d]
MLPASPRCKISTALVILILTSISSSLILNLIAGSLIFHPKGCRCRSHDYHESPKSDFFVYYPRLRFISLVLLFYAWHLCLAFFNSSFTFFFFFLSIPSICVYLSLMNLSSPINENNNSRIISNPSKPHDVFHRSHLSLSSLVTQMANDWSWGFSPCGMFACIREISVPSMHLLSDFSPVNPRHWTGLLCSLPEFGWLPYICPLPFGAAG